MGEDGAASRDRVLDRDHLSAYMRVLVQPAFGVFGAGEEVEHRATAVAGVGVAIVDAGDGRGRLGLPRAAAVGAEVCVEGFVAEGSWGVISIGWSTTGGLLRRRSSCGTDGKDWRSFGFAQAFLEDVIALNRPV
jgi:hypothetical protein